MMHNYYQSPSNVALCRKAQKEPIFTLKLGGQFGVDAQTLQYSLNAHKGYFVGSLERRFGPVIELW